MHDRILLRLSDMEYYDDAVVLIKSFYPNSTIVREDAGKLGEDAEYTDVIAPSFFIDKGKPKGARHDDFKTQLYQELHRTTGRTLPWGKLTGVRPSKIAVAMLEGGAEDTEVLQRFTQNYYVADRKAQLALKVAKKELSLLSGWNPADGYSLYIGIPFCPTTCLYCSFTSYPLSLWEKKIDAYLEALFREMEFVADKLNAAGKRLDTVYIGGGTPTTLRKEQLHRLLSRLEACFDRSGIREFTVEAGRPDSITEEKLWVLQQHQVKRISINPQTMNQKTLDLIGRKHTVEQVFSVFEFARQMGFDNINMDLIVGLPGEEEQDIQNTLTRVRSLAPDSLTVHSLAMKRAAALNIWKERYQDLSMLNTDAIVAAAADCAAALHMEPYYMYRQKNMVGNFENVGYSVSGKECLYNVLIMEEKQSIIALGAGASTKLLFPGQGSSGVRIERIENVKSVQDYITRIDEMIARKDGALFHSYLNG